MEFLHETSTACSELSPRGFQEEFTRSFITPELSRQNAMAPEIVDFDKGASKQQMLRHRKLALQRAFNLGDFDIDTDSINML